MLALRLHELHGEADVPSEVPRWASSPTYQEELKCKVCDEYNDVGNAQPYKGPASKRLGKKFGTFVAMHGADVDGDRIVVSAYDQPIVAVVQQTPTSALVQPVEAVTSPAGWYRDPHGRHEHRYWDGDAWTSHVANGGRASVEVTSGQG